MPYPRIGLSRPLESLSGESQPSRARARVMSSVALWTSILSVVEASDPPALTTTAVGWATTAKRACTSPSSAMFGNPVIPHSATVVDPRSNWSGRMVETPMTFMSGFPFNSATAELSFRHDAQPGVQNQKSTSVPARLTASMVPPPMRVAVNSSSSGTPIESESGRVASRGSVMVGSTVEVVRGTVAEPPVPDEHATAKTNTMVAMLTICVTLRP